MIKMRIPFGLNFLRGRSTSTQRCAASQSSAVQQRSTRLPTSFKQGVTYTYYEANTFHLKFQATGVRVLVDPWLVSDLVFMGQDWLYRGKKRVAKRTKTFELQEVADETDLILITQELDDHCHMPTLQALPKSIPVVAQCGAAEKARRLGFRDVQSLSDGQTLIVMNSRLQITGTRGALVGPPWSTRQLGLVLRESDPQPELHHASVYYEPHCDYDPASVATVGQVDVVITPVRSVLLGVPPVQYPLVQGDMNLDRLVGLLRPRVLVPLLNDEIDQEGPLARLVSSRGDATAVQDRLTAAGFDTRVEFPAPPGESLSLAL